MWSLPITILLSVTCAILCVRVCIIIRDILYMCICVLVSCAHSLTVACSLSGMHGNMSVASQQCSQIGPLSDRQCCIATVTIGSSRGKSG